MKAQDDAEARERGISRTRPGRRADILDAALRLFNDDGYALTSIQDIARSANASVGSIYHHFQGKEHIAASLYVEGLRDYHHGLLRRLRREQDNAAEAVRELVRHHLRWVEANPELARFLLTSRDPEVVGPTDVDLTPMNRQIFEAVGRWIDRWVSAGELPRMPIALFHAIVLGPSQEFSRHWLAGRVRETIDEAEPVLAEAAWKAVRQ